MPTRASRTSPTRRPTALAIDAEPVVDDSDVDDSAPAAANSSQRDAADLDGEANEELGNSQAGSPVESDRGAVPLDDSALDEPIATADAVPSEPVAPWEGAAAGAPLIFVPANALVSREAFTPPSPTTDGNVTNAPQGASADTADSEAHAEQSIDDLFESPEIVASDPSSAERKSADRQPLNLDSTPSAGPASLNARGAALTSRASDGGPSVVRPTVVVTLPEAQSQQLIEKLLTAHAERSAQRCMKIASDACDDLVRRRNIAYRAVVGDFVLQAPVPLDYSIATLPTVLKWMLDQVRLYWVPIDESEPEWIRKSHPHGVPQIDDNCKQFVLSAAFYLGESFARLPGHHWTTGNPKYMGSNMPVVTGFEGDNELPPLVVCENMLPGEPAEAVSEAGIKAIVDHWQSMSLPPSRGR